MQTIQFVYFQLLSPSSSLKAMANDVWVVCVERGGESLLKAVVCLIAQNGASYYTLCS